MNKDLPTRKVRSKPSQIEEAGALMHGASSIKLVIIFFLIYCVIGFQTAEEIRFAVKSGKGLSPTFWPIAISAAVLVALGVVGVVFGKRRGSFIGLGVAAWGSLLFFGFMGGAGAKLYTLMGGRL